MTIEGLREELQRGHRVRRSDWVELTSDPYPERHERVLVERLDILTERSNAARAAFVTALQDAVAATNNPPIAAALQEVPGFDVLHPVVMLLESQDASTLAQAPEFDLWADGESPGEAIENLKREVARLADMLLGADEGSLGPVLLAQKAILQRYLRPQS